ncbi:MAG: type II secretion system GspH family protein [Planctomycetes bacterium]|jgi:prepilin-type N-terminal cleavage/methylation domain-containing protein|nr:type II secretion system GspH family protein [Planctomycetota bacterium]
MLRAARGAAGFTLLEILASLAILGLACSSVLIVIDRCLNSAADSVLRMAAFELVRENLEQVLTRENVEETTDFGTSDRYPDISWETVVEAFPDPVAGQMWLRAVCAAHYPDALGEKQTIELIHWITPLTDQQAGQLAGQQDLEKLETEQIIATEGEAATYAHVDTDTLREWVANGLVKTDNGMFLRHNLDLFVRAKGRPTAEQKAQQVGSVKELATRLQQEGQEPELNGTPETPPDAGGRRGPAGGSSTGRRQVRPEETSNPAPRVRP